VLLHQVEEMDLVIGGKAMEALHEVLGALVLRIPIHNVWDDDLWGTVERGNGGGDGDPAGNGRRLLGGSRESRHQRGRRWPKHVQNPRLEGGPIANLIASLHQRDLCRDGHEGSDRKRP